MNLLNKHRQEITDKLSLFVPNQEAVLVKNRYRIIYATLKDYYPKIFETVEKDEMLKLLKDVVYTDRKWRKLTEGLDKENKDIESQKFQVNELGMEVGLYRDVKQLRNL